MYILKTLCKNKNIRFLRDILHIHTFAVCLLHGRIVGVFVWYKVSGFNVTAIWIFTFSIEDFFV